MAISEDLKVRGYHDRESAARLLCVTVATLSTWRSRGLGPDYVRIGKVVFYRDCDLEAFLAAGRRKPGRPAGSRTRKAA